MNDEPMSKDDLRHLSLAMSEMESMLQQKYQPIEATILLPSGMKVEVSLADGVYYAKLTG